MSKNLTTFKLLGNFACIPITLCDVNKDDDPYMFSAHLLNKEVGVDEVEAQLYQ